MTEAPNTTPVMKADPSDVEKNKIMAILAYILFLIPLLAAPNSPFAKYHANQGLLLFILAVVVNVAGTLIPFLGWFIILPFGYIAVLILMIMGIINAANGEMKPLPLIGQYQLLK